MARSGSRDKENLFLFSKLSVRSVAVPLRTLRPHVRIESVSKLAAIPRPWDGIDLRIIRLRAIDHIEPVFHVVVFVLKGVLNLARRKKHARILLENSLDTLHFNASLRPHGVVLRTSKPG